MRANLFLSLVCFSLAIPFQLHDAVAVEIIDQFSINSGKQSIIAKPRYLSKVNIDSIILINNIQLKNPSFEDVPERGRIDMPYNITSWLDCGSIWHKSESPPDIHPTPDNGWGVNKKAAHGATYLGMVVRDNDTHEALGQRLEKTVKRDNCYEFKVFLSQSKNYVSLSRSTLAEVNYTKPTVLRIWGGTAYCKKDVFLGESQPIAHWDWKEYILKIKSEIDLDYLILEAFYKTPTLLPYNGHILVDGISEIYQISCEK